MQNHQSSEIGSGGVVYCFHDRFLLLESVIVSILKGVYCLFFSRSTMSGNFPSDEVGKSYTHPVGGSINLDEPAAGSLDLHRLHHRWPRCSARVASRVDPLSQTRLGLLLGGLMSLEMPSYSLFCGG